MINIAILGPSDVAFRRMAAALSNSELFTYCGVAVSSEQEWGTCDDFKRVVEAAYARAEKFVSCYGGKIYDSYTAVLRDKSIDAVYLPLPPGLHYKWARMALCYGKHIFVEKPFTTCSADTREIINIAAKKNLAVHENFAFIFHKQIFEIENVILSGEIGELRLIRTAFGFPYRGENDFRYHKEMGGGALLDCGGYPIRLANYLLGGNSIIVSSRLYSAKGHDVDVFGSATLEGENGIVAQISFGMDNSYKCELEIWGSIGTIYTSRIFTPPADLKTNIIVKTDEERHITVASDDQFQNSADFFAECINNDDIRIKNHETICKQAALFDAVISN